MTLKSSLTLRHTKYVAYVQIWAAFCLAIFASQFLGVVEIRTSTQQIIAINNFVIAILFGLTGFFFFRSRLRRIERMVHTGKVGD